MSRESVLEKRGAEWLRTMVRIRRFEETLADLHRSGELVGVVHLSIGQEATAVGICSSLRAGDQITSTHRGHHHMLARGLEPRRMYAEILGRAGGYCGGKGGSMHVSSFSEGAVGANGIVGGGIAHAVGLALAAQRLGKDSVAVAFFGDGAANQGVLFESLNLAALWQVPVLFVCENNGYTEFTPTDAVTAGGSIFARAAVFGLPAEAVDGDDVVAVHMRRRRSADPGSERRRPGVHRVPNEPLARAPRGGGELCAAIPRAAEPSRSHRPARAGDGRRGPGCGRAPERDRAGGACARRRVARCGARRA